MACRIGYGRAVLNVRDLGALWLWADRKRYALLVWGLAVVLFAVSFTAGNSLVDDLVEAYGPRRVDPAERPRGDAALVEQIRKQVSELRGLEWKRRLRVRIVPNAELAERLQRARERGEHPEPQVSDEALLKLLGLIPQDTDYKQLLEDLSRAQVVGFYDFDAEEVVVARSEGAMDPRTMMTVAHELLHALVDQHYRFGDRLEALAEQGRDEEAAALRALAEGDARLIEYAWAELHLTDEEQVAAILGGGGDDDEGAASVIARTPRFVRDASRFPYEEGHDFVKYVYERDGLAGLNRAYKDPPRSTSEILHPERYPDRRPEQLPPPSLSAASPCRVERRGVMGEFDMTKVLELQPSASVAREAAAAWWGDAFGAVRCGTGLGMILRWRSAGAEEAHRFAESVTTWARGWSRSAHGVRADGRFAGGAGAGRVTRSGDVVEVVISRDAATADRVMSAIGG